MTDIKRLPGEVSMQFGAGDVATIKVQVLIEGAPADVSNWTLVSNNCEVANLDLGAGRFDLVFESSTVATNRFTVTRAMPSPRRLITGIVDYLATGDESTQQQQIVVNVLDGETKIELELADIPLPPATLPLGGQEGAVLAKESADDFDAGWTRNLDIQSAQFDINPPNPIADRTVYWDETDRAISYQSNGFNINIGQENVALVRNTGAPIPAGRAVCVLGSAANRIKVGPSDPTTPLSACRTLGVTMEAIGTNQFGFVSTFGVLRGINLAGFAEGDELFVSETPGVLSNTPPAKPFRQLSVGYVVDPKPNGTMFVLIRRGSRLDEDDNVVITDPQAGDVLVFNGTVWVNQPG